ncbi:MAG: DNA gyrase inhibitor YacG [bacterium]|nr:DNA gyrase inhibitor YacG [bacterium]
MASYRCPTCHQISRAPRREDIPHRPFCSRRCQLIDLNHWFEGDYRISDPLVSDADGLETDDLTDIDRPPGPETDLDP